MARCTDHTITVFWHPRGARYERAIRERFGIKSGMTVNGESPAVISDGDWTTFMEVARRCFIEIREWKPELEHLLNYHG